MCVYVCVCVGVGVDRCSEFESESERREQNKGVQKAHTTSVSKVHRKYKQESTLEKESQHYY
jgi:hypothetical protein